MSTNKTRKRKRNKKTCKEKSGNQHELTKQENIIKLGWSKVKWQHYLCFPCSMLQKRGKNIIDWVEVKSLCFLSKSPNWRDKILVDQGENSWALPNPFPSHPFSLLFSYICFFHLPYFTSNQTQPKSIRINSCNFFSIESTFYFILHTFKKQTHISLFILKFILIKY